MPLPRSSSLWKSYGVQQLPGNTPSNHFVRNTHGGGNERSEGLSQWPFAPMAADPTVRTGYPYVAMRQDYDPASLRPIPKPYHPGMVSTQTSASRHRVEQRYMGSGINNWNRDIRGDATTTNVPQRFSYTIVIEPEHMMWLTCLLVILAVLLLLNIFTSFVR